jgi:hypothetical protein
VDEFVNDNEILERLRFIVEIKRKRNRSNCRKNPTYESYAARAQPVKSPAV